MAQSPGSYQSAFSQFLATNPEEGDTSQSASQNSESIDSFVSYGVDTQNKQISFAGANFGHGSGAFKPVQGFGDQSQSSPVDLSMSGTTSDQTSMKPPDENSGLGLLRSSYQRDDDSMDVSEISSRQSSDSPVNDESISKVLGPKSSFAVQNILKAPEKSTEVCMDESSVKSIDIPQLDAKPKAISMVGDLLDDTARPIPESSSEGNIAGLSQEASSTEPATGHFKCVTEDAALLKDDDKSTLQEPIPKPETEEKENIEESSEKPVEPEVVPDVMSADRVFEYQWPHETGGDIFMLQEQLSEFLGVLSFKRKYPDLTRRPVEYKERIFLMERGAVTETQCDLGLTPLRSEEIYELMSKDYPEKYKEYMQSLRDREKKKLSEQNKEYSMQSLEKTKMDFFLKKAMKSCADFNAQFLREKREERRAYMDLQTLEVHHPKNKMKVMPKEVTKVGSYPVALIPGQYQDYYKRYTPQELKYFPLSTALYSPHKALRTIYADPGVEEEKQKQEAPAEEETAKDDDSSSSDDSQSGSSDSDADSIEPETDTVKISEEQIKKLLATPRPDTPPKKKRKSKLNAGEAVDSDKDSTVGAPRGRPRKTPAKNTPAKTPRVGRKAVVKPRVTGPQCSICQEATLKGSDGEPEELTQCSECKKFAHPSCLELTDEMVPIIKTYAWQCMECKTCVKCNDAQDEENMMFCDHCDRGYHTWCVGLKEIPPGRWECLSCQPEGSDIPTFVVMPKPPMSAISPTPLMPVTPLPKKKGRPKLEKNL